jgi:hypothetical protein
MTDNREYIKGRIEELLRDNPPLLKQASDSARPALAEATLQMIYELSICTTVMEHNEVSNRYHVTLIYPNMTLPCLEYLNAY